MEETLKGLEIVCIFVHGLEAKCVTVTGVWYCLDSYESLCCWKRKKKLTGIQACDSHTYINLF